MHNSRHLPGWAGGVGEKAGRKEGRKEGRKNEKKK
jgi:hypothetical protein